jgi:hypothetical protein
MRGVNILKTSIILLSLLTLPYANFSQELNYINILPKELKESSGLIYLDNRLITLADSHNPPALYEIDTITGEIKNTVYIENASNVDWEDIATDDSFIYIADFGNNYGMRKDLRIYRVRISDFLHAQNDSIQADTIDFAYEDQKDFSDQQFHTNYDAEGLIALGDSLYIFTKNWGDFKCNVYALPKTADRHIAHKVDSFDTRCLVTAASYHEGSKCLQLTCQIPTTAFFIEVKNVQGFPTKYQEVEKIKLKTPLFIAWQIESITPIDNKSYYITAEGGYTGRPALFKFIKQSGN